jgi:tRNA A-37 threonylcarbamoyl transferase component Bud32
MTMQRVRKNNIRWFLDDCAGLAAMVGAIVEGEDSRRSYSILECGEKKAFVKFFLERGAIGWLRNRLNPRGRKEYALAKRLLSETVATPAPMGYGIGKGGSFIIEELIEGETLKSAFDGAARKEPLVDALALFLRRLSARGVRHNDLHLDNVLVKGETLYLIDLHKACIKKGGFTRKDEVKNLTQGLTMIYGEMTEAARRRFFEGYGRPGLRPAVEASLRSQWKAWIDSKKKRAFSTTSKLVARGRRVYVRGREQEARGAFRELIKKDRKVRVERYGDHIRKVYARKRRLVRAWETWAALQYVGLEIAPRPFFVEKPFMPGGGYVAMEDLAGQGEELDRFLDRNYDAMDLHRRRAFIDGFARFLARLLKMGIVQKDLKGCNVFVLDGAFRLLDVEDIAFFTPGEKDLKALLAQLNNSLPARIAAADRIRFFLKLTRSFPFDLKRLFRQAAAVCAAEEIVYEGAYGLKRESWQGRRPDFPERSRRRTR